MVLQTWVCASLAFSYPILDPCRSERKRFGLLEKHKDYVLRARDYHKKEEAIRVSFGTLCRHPVWTNAVLTF